MSTLVTGDAVVLELPPAGIATRLLGFIIDFLVYVVLLILLFVVLFAFLASGDAAFAAAVSVVTIVAVLVVVPTVVETLSRGRSLGKLATGLRVVRDDGGPIRTRQALTRQLVGFGEFYLLYGMVTIFVVLANSRTKRLGDLLAGTYVINERTPMLRSAMAAMPPELGAWARTADIGRIQGPLALDARNYLTRAATMTPSAAATLSGQLASELATLVAPLPPPGTSADRFISAVLAERRRRDTERLGAERSQVQRLHDLVDRRRDVV